MVRAKRFKAKGDVAFYHVVSRIAGGKFLLGDVEKEKLLSVIKQYSSLYFVNVIGYCIMEDKITKKERKAHKIPIDLPNEVYSIQRISSI